MYIEIPPLSLSLSNIGELKKEGQLAIRNSNESCEKNSYCELPTVHTMGIEPYAYLCQLWLEEEA